MNVEKKYLVIPVLFLTAALSFISCGNALQGSAGGNAEPSTVCVSGALSLGAALPESIARSLVSSSDSSRTAFPSIPTTGLAWSVYAYNTAAESEKYYGTVSEDKTSYVVPIPADISEKNYKVKIEVRSSGQTILSGTSRSFPISTSSDLNTSIDVALSADQTSLGDGYIGLEIDVSGTDIVRCNFAFSSSLSFDRTKDSDGKIPVSTPNSVARGAHRLAFSFYDEDGNLLYSFSEIINVFINLTTNTWVQNGAEPYLVTTTDEQGNRTTTCRITAAMVEGFKLTQIFVDPSVTASGSGTFLHPKKTFEEATEMLCDETKDYTIYIKGELRGSYTVSSVIEARSLTICGARGLNTAGEPQDGIRGYADELVGHEYDFNYITNLLALDDEEKTGGALCIQAPVPVTLKNIKLCNCVGEGLYVDSTSTVTLEDVVIFDNKASMSAGGVWVRCGTVIMNSGKIIGNSSYNSAENNKGGGVFVDENGSFTMNGGTISGNLANRGGAVYVDGTFKINGSAYIPAGYNGETGKSYNDIYLPAGKTIKIAGRLTPPSACTSGIVATITPENYAPGTQLIELETGVTDTTLEEAVTHFAVTPHAGDTDLYFIDAEGKLLTPVMFVNGAYATGANSTAVHEGISYKVVNYSYLSYENLEISVSNPYGSDLPLTTTIDGGTPVTGAITSQELSDGYHTVTTTLTRPDGTTESGTKRICVKIKPVKVQIIGQLHIYADSSWHNENPCIRNNLYVDVDNPDDLYEGEKLCLAENNNPEGRVGKGSSGMDYYRYTSEEYNYVWLTAKSSIFYFYGDDCFDYCSEAVMGKCEKGNANATRTLEGLKSDIRFETGNLYNGSCYCLYGFSVSIDDTTNP